MIWIFGSSSNCPTGNAEDGINSGLITGEILLSKVSPGVKTTGHEVMIWTGPATRPHTRRNILNFPNFLISSEMRSSVEQQQQKIPFQHSQPQQPGDLNLNDVCKDYDLYKLFRTFPSCWSPPQWT